MEEEEREKEGVGQWAGCARVSGVGGEAQSRGANDDTVGEVSQ